MWCIAVDKSWKLNTLGDNFVIVLSSFQRPAKAISSHRQLAAKESYHNGLHKQAEKSGYWRSV